MRRLLGIKFSPWQLGVDAVLLCKAAHYCTPPPDPKMAALTAAFGKEWTMFARKVPNWEKDLVHLDVGVLNAMLVGFGVDASHTAAMALMDYFNRRHDGDDDKKIIGTEAVHEQINRRELELFREWKESKEWKEQLAWDSNEYDRIMNAKCVRQSSENVISVIEPRDGKWYATDEGTSVLPSSQLLVRTWHNALWKRYKTTFATPGHVVAITGSPGIGKTLGLNFILYKYLQAAEHRSVPKSAAAESSDYEDSDESEEDDDDSDYFAHESEEDIYAPWWAARDEEIALPVKEHEQHLRGNNTVVHRRYVALILPNDACYYIFDTVEKKACRVSLHDDPTTSRLDPFYEDLFVLHDLGNDAPLTPRRLPTVISTPLKYANINEFMKSSPKFFYVPLFSDDEMDFVATHVCPKTHTYDAVWPRKAGGAVCTTWRDAAYYCGHVPRLVFSRDSVQTVVNKQLRFQTLKHVLNANQQEATVNVNDQLVECIPTRNYKDYLLSYRKGYVAAYLCDSLVKKEAAPHIRRFQGFLDKIKK